MRSGIRQHSFVHVENSTGAALLKSGNAASVFVEGIQHHETTLDFDQPFHSASVGVWMRGGTAAAGSSCSESTQACDDG